MIKKAKKPQLLAYEIGGNISQLRYQGYGSIVKYFPCKHKDLCLILITHVEALPITAYNPDAETETGGSLWLAGKPV